MNLKKISIENFKCFGSQVDIDFGRITLLTGANSSGKSSVIYSILGAIQSGEFPFQFSTNGKYVNMGDYKEIVHNHIMEDKIKLDFTFEGKNVIKKVETVWIENKKNNLPKLYQLSSESSFFNLSIHLKEDNYFLNFEYEPLKSPEGDFIRDINKEILGQMSEESEDVDKKFKIIKELRNSRSIEELKIDMPFTGGTTDIFLAETLNNISSLFSKYDDQINYIGSFRYNPERTYLEQNKSKLKVNNFGDGYLDQIIYWETHDDPKIVSLINTLRNLKLLHSIKSNRLQGGQYEMVVKTKKDGIGTSLSDVGFGVSQFLPILVADLQLPETSTLFIAQPEIHLHPSIQSSFGDYLANQINSTSKNYVIETHSEYLLNKIRLAIVKGEIKEEDVKIYFLDNEAEDNVVHKISFTPQGQIINAPKNFFKTYMMDVMEIAINAAG